MSAADPVTESTVEPVAERVAELRVTIDALDRRIVALLAERTAVVRELTEHKRDERTVRSPGRVEQVVARVRALAEEHGMPPGIAEAAYRALIAELTAMQMERLHERRAAAGSTTGAGDGAT
ncbi:chorismate mutase [Streptomyces sp. NPDC049879]|uniref:chorismate mutase n=1 Tax=Streptomyces sp. NPDC049879 TaxID=3365598 RepID=UPI0037A3C70E